MNIFWKNQFDDHERVISNTGLPVEPVYYPVVDKETGHYELECSAEVRPVYQEIQSFADSCDVKKIVQRYMAGDESALDKVQALYGDLTKMPKNIFEFFELEARVNDIFDKLRPDIKERFDNSSMQFAMLASTDPEEWHRRQNIEMPVSEEVKEGGNEE